MPPKSPSLRIFADPVSGYGFAPPSSHPPGLHIAVVQRICSPLRGGAERYSVNLCRGLRRLGCRVTVVAQEMDEALQREFAFRPVQVDMSSSWAKNLSFARNAPRVCAETGCDLVLGLGQVPDVDVVRVTGRIHRHFLRMWYRATHRLQAWNPRHRAILKLERQMFGPDSKIQRFIVQSELERRLLQSHYGVPDHRITVIYNGVDTETFHPHRIAEAPPLLQEFGLSSEEPLAVFAAQGDFERKGLRVCLEALERSRHRSVKLVVLGKGRTRGFRSLLSRPGLRNRVIFAGSQADVAPWMAAAGLFLLPTWYEPFPNVNLEAMACGTPVITTATCGGAEIIEPDRTGYSIPDAQSVAALTAHLDQYFSLSHGDRTEMSAACVELAAKFTVDRNAAAVAEVLASQIAVPAAA